ncbi:hypothetical protein HPB47_014627 [Ixodes persulcatus]|uniref:Uncharacterized protein n=1 Tax=Ixodes persulcatus TaxID=34615 RepID=A0AC60QY22_IXOPE|nr:hypothetical protein HPB47_014627 [Ixodes persulcatus]
MGRSSSFRSGGRKLPRPPPSNADPASYVDLDDQRLTRQQSFPVPEPQIRVSTVPAALRANLARLSGTRRYKDFERFLIRDEGKVSRASTGTIDNRSPFRTGDDELTMVKVYARVLCADMEYKTLSIDPGTSSTDVVRMLLNKFKMKHRDPNLFYLTMEVWMRKTGIPIRTIMVLDDEARPVELQSCHPKGESKFLLQMRRGGLVKVYDSCLMAGSLYKSLLVSERTTAEEVVQLVLHCYNSSERASKFSLYEMCPVKNYERALHSHELPLRIQQNWPSPEHFAFHLRRNQEGTHQKRQLPWTCQTDLSGHLNFRLNASRNELSPAAIHSPTLKPSYNNYENCFYI